MNGLSDQQEPTSPDTWQRITDRDRGCPGGGVAFTCSGIDQPDREFTRIAAGL